MPYPLTAAAQAQRPAAIGGPKIYAGHHREPVSGLDYMKARWCNSETGTFLSVDPLIGDVGDPQAHNELSQFVRRPLSLTSSVPPDSPLIVELLKLDRWDTSDRTGIAPATAQCFGRPRSGIPGLSQAAQLNSGRPATGQSRRRSPHKTDLGTGTRSPMLRASIPLALCRPKWVSNVPDPQRPSLS